MYAITGYLLTVLHRLFSKILKSRHLYSRFFSQTIPNHLLRTTYLSNYPNMDRDNTWEEAEYECQLGLVL